MALLSILRSNWFIIGIVLVIISAKFDPDIGSKGGILKPEITVKYVAVFIIFFNSGLSLKTEEFTKAIFQVKIHVFIQGFTFIIFPLLMQTLATLLASGPFDKHLIEGLKVLGCMPPPVSSAVILTKAAVGNEAAAIFNSALGSFLGIFVTPTLILMVVGSQADVPITTIIVQLCMTVVVPLVTGQVVRRFVRVWMERTYIPFSTIGSGILLLIIYTTFCDTFSHKDVNLDAINLMSIILLIVIIQSILLTLIFFFSSWKQAGFQPVDCPAVMFCATHKSLTLGIPIVKIIFSGDPTMSVITIPLLVYHPTQILIGSLIVPFLRGWLLLQSKHRKNITRHV
ncbi:sodium/bile acid cotransporter 7-B-like [Ylistrum balloti]|uniref:sodium/bile acid cotransporter 7-B-like n=1 Tax=Ylistrum balloti TaxID=509963 RepID=UPI00290583DC|nr:sodium/bile acid cotransporter 7-B-like [Ylistrum balloti]